MKTKEELERHPLMRNRAIIHTRPLEEFVNIIRLWLDNLIPGGIIWGYQRVGKTRAVRYLINHCEALYGKPLPVTLFSTWDGKWASMTPDGFSKELLRSLGHVAPDSGSAIDKRHRIISFMADRARHMNEYRYLLFVDEAQWLTIEQLNFLMDIHNQLELQDISMITVLVGTPVLVEQKVTLRNAQLRHLLGRFMVVVHRHQGITGRSDFRRILRSFDTSSEYPAGSECTFTQYFVPIAFESGWRLEDQADELWDIFESICRLKGVPQCDDWPMQGFIALLRWLMESLAAVDEADLKLDPSLVEIAFDRVATEQLDDHAQTMDVRSPVKQLQAA